MDKVSYIIGVDIGGTTVKMGLFTRFGQLEEKWSIPTRAAELESDGIILNIVQSMKEMVAQKGIRWQDVCGIGIGVPGPVKNGVVSECPNLGWYEIDIENAFYRHCAIPVKVENDANIAALGELWQGAAKDCDNFVMLTLGTGVGGALVLNRRIFSGATGSAGEFGHMTVSSDETVPCGCGKYGCLEQYVSAKGLLNVVQNRRIAGEATSLPTDGVTTEQVFLAAQAGDTLASGAVESMAQKLAQAMADITVVCDPQLLLIGGGVSEAGEFLLSAIQRHYRTFAFGQTNNTVIKLAQLRNQAGIWGAAYLFAAK